MKTNLRVYGLIVSCLLIVFMVACGRDGDDRLGTYTDYRVGGYNLLRYEVEIDGSVVSKSFIDDPTIATSTLFFYSDGKFLMVLDEGIPTENIGSVSGTWTSTVLNIGGETIPYSFNSDFGYTIEFSYRNLTLVWNRL